MVEVIDKSKAWTYFDVAYQNNSQRSGVGGVIFHKESHILNLKSSLARGTRNLAKLRDLKLTLIFYA